MASDDDKGAALKAVLERLSQRARRPVTLPSLIEGWQRFVDEVTTGYDATIYDYTNSLSLRDHLGEVIAALRPGAAYEIERGSARRQRTGVRVAERDAATYGSVRITTKQQARTVSAASGMVRSIPPSMRE